MLHILDLFKNKSPKKDERKRKLIKGTLYLSGRCDDSANSQLQHQKLHLVAHEGGDDDEWLDVLVWLKCGLDYYEKVK